MSKRVGPLSTELKPPYDPSTCTEIKILIEILPHINPTPITTRWCPLGIMPAPMHMVLLLPAQTIMEATTTTVMTIIARTGKIRATGTGNVMVTMMMMFMIKMTLTTLRYGGNNAGSLFSFENCTPHDTNAGAALPFLFFFFIFFFSLSVDAWDPPHPRSRKQVGKKRKKKKKKKRKQKKTKNKIKFPKIWSFLILLLLSL